MKSIIKSICILDTTRTKDTNYQVRIVTKSNKVIEYNFDTHELALNYYNDIVSWQYDYDKMSMTKSHSGILVNVNYQLNKRYTFTD